MDKISLLYPIQKQPLLLLIYFWQSQSNSVKFYSKTTFVTVNHVIKHAYNAQFEIQKQPLLLLIEVNSPIR